MDNVFHCTRKCDTATTEHCAVAQKADPPETKMRQQLASSLAARTDVNCATNAPDMPIRDTSEKD